MLRGLALGLAAIAIAVGYLLALAFVQNSMAQMPMYIPGIEALPPIVAATITVALPFVAYPVLWLLISLPVGWLIAHLFKRLSLIVALCVSVVSWYFILFRGVMEVFSVPGWYLKLGGSVATIEMVSILPIVSWLLARRPSNKRLERAAHG